MSLQLALKVIFILTNVFCEIFTKSCTHYGANSFPVDNFFLSFLSKIELGTIPTCNYLTIIDFDIFYVLKLPYENSPKL